MKERIIIVGGGAAGFFTANVLGESLKDKAEIIILEKTQKVLSKVKISGGGRCNVTNACTQPNTLAQNYPRGEKALRKLFKIFNPSHTIEWFAQRGVELKTEADNRIFPITDSSQTIIDCFLKGIQKYNVLVQRGVKVNDIIPPTNENEEWTIHTDNQELHADYVIVTTGSNEGMWDLLKKINYKIIDPLPSLFTFKLIDERLKELSGVSLHQVQVKIVGTKLQQEGAFLVTHWGISGPAVLKLSAWGAVELAQKDYHFFVHLNFTGDKNFDSAREEVISYKQEHGKRTIINYPLFQIPQRLWKMICEKTGITEQLRWIDISKKQLNKLLTEITQGEYEAKGKTTFKEEFVTCGGVDLSMVNLQKMESQLHPNLFFAGEVLNIDAITGGFNFQGAWTTSWVLSQTIIDRILTK
ncbi:MAG: NAD(P)/FAD-dependent oxidoreductase [Cytophagales bacterium]|nr:NAD(P)/FAD-dependent oxidoreductase [Cytophagales bacterium]